MNRTWTIGCLLVSLSIAAAAGCGGDKNKRYVPTSNTARKALDQALSTWKSGARHGRIASDKPAIDVFDSRWQAGNKLKSYEILEEITGTDHPQFKVRIELDGQREETATYRVVGIDPLLVFREEDYRKATGQ